MKILVSRAAPALIQELGLATYVEHCGMLITPRSNYDLDLVIAHGVTWAADNDCFNGGLDKAAFVTLLKRIATLPGCKFVTAPDVVGDAQATALRFKLWQPVIHYYGLPVALVAQDGLENLPLDWDSFDALFIGGSTAWKLSHHAARLAQEAKGRGKWVHMGRVNSHLRLSLARVFGCDSVDGTGYARYSRTNIPPALRAMSAHREQPSLEGIWF